MLKKLSVSRHRISGLDSLRGIAALIVVFRHFFDISPELATSGQWLFEVTPFHHLIAGRHAVIMFFVLSGFVLSIPYFNGFQQDYRKFIIRRICRIYVPFLVGICAAGLLWISLAQGHASLAPEGGDWSHPVDFGIFGSHLMMAGLVGTTVLNPPMWTLIVEMRVSFVFPLLVILIKRFSYVGVIASIPIGYLTSKLYVSLDGSDNFFVSKTVIGTLLLTLYYIQFFLMGVILSDKIKFFKQLISSVPVKLHFLIALLLVFIPVNQVTSSFIIHDLYYAASSSYLILCCASFEKFNGLLSGGVLSWLGKVSYSMYLIHLPILLAIYYAMGGATSEFTLLIVALLVILIASELMNRYVEIPAMKLGKRLTRS